MGKTIDLSDLVKFPLIQCLIQMSRIQRSTISAARECFAQN